MKFPAEIVVSLCTKISLKIPQERFLPAISTDESWHQYDSNLDADEASLESETAFGSGWGSVRLGFSWPCLVLRTEPGKSYFTFSYPGK
jgi:hypothetical protein